MGKGEPMSNYTTIDGMKYNKALIYKAELYVEKTNSTSTIVKLDAMIYLNILDKSGKSFKQRVIDNLQYETNASVISTLDAMKENWADFEN